MIQNCHGSSCSWTLRPEVPLLLRQLCFPFPVWEMEEERHPEDPMTSARNTRCSHRTSLLRVKFVSCFPVFLRTFHFSFQWNENSFPLFGPRRVSLIISASSASKFRTEHAFWAYPAYTGANARAPHPVWIAREGWLGAHVFQHCLPIDFWLHLWKHSFKESTPDHGSSCYCLHEFPLWPHLSYVLPRISHRWLRTEFFTEQELCVSSESGISVSFIIARHLCKLYI